MKKRSERKDAKSKSFAVHVDPSRPTDHKTGRASKMFVNRDTGDIGFPREASGILNTKLFHP